MLPWSPPWLDSEFARLSFFVRRFIEPIVIGIGSGSTVVYAAERLGEIKKNIRKSLNDLNLICVATGFQSENLILHNKLRLGTIAYYPKKLGLGIRWCWWMWSSIELCQRWWCLFTTRKTCCLICWKVCHRFADDRKKVPHLSYGWRIPIEVINNALPPVEIQLKKSLWWCFLKDCIIRENPCLRRLWCSCYW